MGVGGMVGALSAAAGWYGCWYCGAGLAFAAAAEVGWPHLGQKRVFIGSGELQFVQFIE